MRVLIVEDGADRQALLKRLVEGHEVQLATTGAEGMRLVEAHTFDLVFLDFDLADEVKGVEVARALQRAGYSPEVVIQSMNPAGVEEILEVLPHAHPISIEMLRPRGAHFGLVKSRLASGLMVDWGALG